MLSDEEVRQLIPGQVMHARPGYDPAKAHEYYMRTRQLHGRKAGGGSSPSGGRQPAAKKAPAKPHQSQQEKVAALKKRLERLKDVLAQLVKEAKARSGVETHTPAAKKSTSSKSGGSSKLTPQERKKAAEASADYRKKHPEKKSPKEEVAALEQQIKEIRAKIQNAVEEARRAQRQPTKKTASNVR